MKIAVIGGGSTYTPELVSGLARLDVDDFVLHDIYAERRVRFRALYPALKKVLG